MFVLGMEADGVKSGTNTNLKSGFELQRRGFEAPIRKIL